MAESQELKRPRFYTGQVLTAESLELEQQYFREKLKRHNRTLHGFGIVSGLEVSVQSGQIIVEPGLALDCGGNELVIPSARPVGVPSTTDGFRAWYVCVRYVEEDTDYVPALTDGPAATSTDNGAKASTITEASEVEIAHENYNRGHRHIRARWLACGEAHALTIAKLKLSSQGWRVERGYRSPKVK